MGPGDYRPEVGGLPPQGPRRYLDTAGSCLKSSRMCSVLRKSAQQGRQQSSRTRAPRCRMTPTCFLLGLPKLCRTAGSAPGPRTCPLPRARERGRSYSSDSWRNSRLCPHHAAQSPVAPGREDTAPAAAEAKGLRSARQVSVGASGSQAHCEPRVPRAEPTGLWAPTGRRPPVRPQHGTRRAGNGLSLHRSLAQLPRVCSRGVSGPRKHVALGGGTRQLPTPLPPRPPACVTGSQVQGALRGLWGGPTPTLPAAAEEGPHPCPGPRSPPTWDIKVSQAEDRPNPMDTPQTLTNWRRTRGRTGCQVEPEEGAPPRGLLGAGDPPGRARPALCAPTEALRSSWDGSRHPSPGQKVPAGLAVLTATERVTAASSTLPRCPQKTELTT